MESNKFVQTTAPTPTLAGRKRYFLLPAALLVAYLSYLAFAEPPLFSVDFDKKRIAVACMAAFFFMGLLVWAGKENDKDKAWEEILNKHLESSKRTNRAEVKLADLLPEGSDELAATLDSPMAAKFDSSDSPGVQLNRWFANSASTLARFGVYMIAMPVMQFVIRWSFGAYSEADLIVAITTMTVGIITVLPVAIVWMLNRRKPMLTSTGYKKIDAASAKHRRYAFYKYHRQVLLDNGFEELFDVQFDSTTCTLFASSNRDTIVEVGIFNYGRLYFGARTITEDGTMFQTRSGGYDPGTPLNPDSVQVSICERKPIETLLRKHAVLLANRLIKSKSRLVTLKDQAIDQLFLANRFRHTPINFYKRPTSQA